MTTNSDEKIEGDKIIILTIAINIYLNKHEIFKMKIIRTWKYPQHGSNTTCTKC